MGAYLSLHQLSGVVYSGTRCVTTEPTDAGRLVFLGENGNSMLEINMWGTDQEAADRILDSLGRAQQEDAPRKLTDRERDSVQAALDSLKVMLENNMTAPAFRRAAARLNSIMAIFQGVLG